MHEVLVRKCGLITQSLRHVTIEIVELSIYEGLLELSAFLMEFEEKVYALQRLVVLEEVLEDTPTHWWVTHKKTINGWAQCRCMMIIHFGNAKIYHDGRYNGWNDPNSHLIEG